MTQIASTVVELAELYGHSVPCTQCGYELSLESVAKRRLRGNTDTLCPSCRSTKLLRIKYGNDYCTPWQGEFDLDTNTCIKNGKPYMVGERTCGHFDCIAKAHVIIAEPKKKRPYRPKAEGFNFYETYVRIMGEEAAKRLRENS
jgi:hypothetical protein